MTTANSSTGTGSTDTTLPEESSTKKLANILNMSERDLESAQEIKVYSEQAGYGFTFQMAAEIYNLMVNHPQTPFALIIACIGAIGQIKNNLSSNDLMRRMEDVFDLSTSDKATGRPSVNFGAVRMIGMAFCALIGEEIPIVAKLSKKAGNVWTDTTFPETEAGKINAELAKERGGLTLPAVSPDKRGRIISGLKSFYSESKGGYSKDAKATLEANLKKAMEKR